MPLAMPLAWSPVDMLRGNENERAWHFFSSIFLSISGWTFVYCFAFLLVSYCWSRINGDSKSKHLSERRRDREFATSLEITTFLNNDVKRQMTNLIIIGCAQKLNYSTGNFPSNEWHFTFFLNRKSPIRLVSFELSCICCCVRLGQFRNFLLCTRMYDFYISSTSLLSKFSHNTPPPLHLFKCVMPSCRLINSMP